MTPAVAQQTGSDNTAIRPFNVNDVPEAELTDSGPSPEWYKPES